ncbi:hypothetical protein GGR58DRAFT_465706 [Xylaria digitata]|nr:hypothetical protein GGR58DRAFT_465706 [Xylaria digitata]
MDGLRQNIAEIDCAIIEAHQWLKEAKTEREVELRQAKVDKLEAALVSEQAKYDAARILEDRMDRMNTG